MKSSELPAKITQVIAFGVLVGLTCLTALAEAQALQGVSARDLVQAPPAGGDGGSFVPVLSRDGRFVLFASAARNLILLSTNTPLPARLAPKLNVYLRDRINQTTILVSSNSSATDGGNGDSVPLDLSTNGQYALFESVASDLVLGDTNKASDIFVRDLNNGLISLISIGTNGAVGNGASSGAAMTPDGRYIAFASAASNLVAGDTNNIPDVFVRDRLY